MAGRLIPVASKELPKLRGLMRMQKLCCVKHRPMYNVFEARVASGTAACCGSVACRSRCWLLLLLVTGQGCPVMGKGGFCFLMYTWARVSVFSTYGNRKKWHINASVKIVKPSLGNGLDC